MTVIAAQADREGHQADTALLAPDDVLVVRGDPGAVRRLAADNKLPLTSAPPDEPEINLRVHPQQDAGEAQQALIRHLEKVRPFGIGLTVTRGATGNGFAASTSGPAYDADAPRCQRPGVARP